MVKRCEYEHDTDAVLDSHWSMGPAMVSSQVRDSEADCGDGDGDDDDDGGGDDGGDDGGGGALLREEKQPTHPRCGFLHHPIVSRDFAIHR